MKETKDKEKNLQKKLIAIFNVVYKLGTIVNAIIKVFDSLE